MLFTRRRIETGIVGLLLVSLTGFALVHQGVPATEVDLHDGGVWVTNPAEGLVGHLNYQSRTLDGGLDPASHQFDVSQEGNRVLLHDSQGSAAATITTASLLLNSRVSVGDMTVVQGDDTVLIADTAGGKVWATTLEDFASFNTASATPVAEDLQQPRVTAGRGGVGFIVDAAGAVTRVTSRDHHFTTEDAGRLDGGITSDTQLTVAGDEIVAVGAGRVRTTGRSIDVPQADGTARAQLPSRTGGQVSIATPSALITVPLGGGSPTTTDVPQGEPAAPADVAGCVYGAWGGSGAYVRDCAGDGDDLNAVNDTLAAAKTPVFRTNRDIVAINDAAGNVYLPNEGMKIVSNWELVRSQVQEQKKETEEESDDEVRHEQSVENQDQVPPVATDDEFGARPGTSTSLPVLLNDIDADGDVLTVKLGDIPEGVQVTSGRNGRSAQIFLPPGQTAPVTFTYQAFDGQDLSNTATVTVTPRSAGENSPPEKKRDSTVSMSEQASVEYSALPDWVDPDGDPLYLVNAVGDDGMQVTFRQDGYLSLRDNGTGGPGARKVQLTVSDGKQEASGELQVQVASGATNLPPIANADHYVVNLGEEVVLRPLCNDSDPNGEPLQLSELGQPASDETLQPDFEQATALFSSTRAGTHEITYKVSDGPNTAESRIRIDVLDPATASKTPSAENDLALLPESSSTVVNVLENDSDPAGGVLAVRSLSMGNCTGLNAEVIDHSSLRLSAPAGLQESCSFTYSVSNGAETASATVLVLPQPPKATNQPPVAVDDQATVRAGDIVTIPVLDNDYSPTDLDLSVAPDVEVRDPDIGQAFVSGNLVRFKAGQTPGAVNLVYTTTDAAGNRASAKISVTVRGLDAGNQKPNPVPVTARVFSDSEVDIAVPLDGVDPDGDSVELVEGGSTGPTLGRAQVKGGYLTYKAPRGASGTDTFTYQVRDRFGDIGEGKIRVGVIPPPDSNQLPVAVPDQIKVRPGQRFDLPVTKNDVDPDGDTISIVNGSARPLGSWQTDLEVVGQDVRVVAPEKEGSYQLSYDITDKGGAPVTGYATVLVDQNAPLLPPVAADDRVPMADVFRNREVEVPVLENDEDPDGARDDLTVSVAEPARVTGGGNVVVPVAEDPQVVLYTIRDKDGNTAQAAIFVPGTRHLPPTLDPDQLPAQAKSGETLQIDLSKYVLTRPDHVAKVTSADSVTAASGAWTGGPDQGLKVVSDTMIEFTPDPSFNGPTSVTFGVYDGADPDDPNGLRATLTLPIEVISSGAAPPVLRPTPVEVAPGEAPIDVALKDMVDDPDEGDNERMTYQLLSAPTDQFDVTVTGQQMQVSAKSGVPTGTSGTAVVQVHDGSTDPLQMSIPLSVVTSTRPLITTTELTEPDGRVGQSKTFDLAQAITNPFADQGGQVTILDPQVTQGTATVAASGMELTVTPGAVGSVVVTYVAQDATGDASRQVIGQVSITVKDKPQPPSNLTAKSDVSGTVELAWTQGDLNGGALQSFVVNWNGGSQNCPAVTNCRVTGLQNNVDYSFTVSAVTEAGTSDPSAPATARPDAKPNQPAVPTTKFGDRVIDLSWPATTVPDGGSPVTQYKIQVSPGINGQTEFTTADTAWQATGLSNGTAYRFRIQALNRYAEGNVARESEYLWSDYSAPEIPAGAPTGQGAPTVNKNKASGAAPSATVSWGAPGDANGDRSFVYELRESGSGEVKYSGPATSTTVTMSVSSEDKTFQVRSSNKSGLWSDWSSASNAVRAFQPPGAPTGFSLTPTGVSNQVKFSFSGADGKGTRAGEIRYRWSAGGASGVVGNGETVTNGAFVNGRDVAVNLTAIATVNGETAEGDSATATVNAYAPPEAPVVSAEGTYRRVNYSWSHDPNSGGRPSTITTSTGERSSAGSGGGGQDVDFGTQTCITVTATNSEGQSASTQKCNSSWPAPKAADLHGPPLGSGEPCSFASCDQFHVRLDYWKPNSAVVCTISYNGYTSSGRLNVDQNGYFQGRFEQWFIDTRFPAGNDITSQCKQQ